jgi:5'-3' exonuclease
MLAGDPVDNIQGVPKIGPVKAKKILNDNEDIQDAWIVIREAYRDSYSYNADDVMLEMGRLLWIRHNVGEMWDLPDFEDELDKKEGTNG